MSVNPDEETVTALAVGDVAGTLLEEHAALMREVASRSEALLALADQGRWPQRETNELVNYLQLEVLREVGEQRSLAFSTTHDSPDQAEQRNRTELEIREAIEQLTQAAASGQGVDASTSPRRLAGITRQLMAKLEAVVAAEQRDPGDLEYALSTAGLGAQPHEWYALIEGPTIDLDKLPGERGTQAAMGRVLRLHVGETVELQSSTNPKTMLDRLTGADRETFGLEYVESGPHRWRVQLIRRS